MTKFIKGETVAVYDGPKRITGIVKGLSDDGQIIYVNCERGDGVLFHPKQCRRITIKKKVINRFKSKIEALDHHLKTMRRYHGGDGTVPREVAIETISMMIEIVEGILKEINGA